MNLHTDSFKSTFYQSTTSLLIFTTLSISTAASAETQTAEKDDKKSQFTVGSGLAYVPEYEGSEDYKVSALPVINYRNGRFFAGALGGIGYDLSNKEDLSFGPVLSYQFGRDESDNDQLEGLGDIDPSVTLGAFGRWNLQPFSLNSTVKHSLGGDANGAQIKLGAGYALPLSAKDIVNFEASIDWADQEVMEAYFGVSPEQSSRSGLGEYEVSSGIRRYGIGASWTHIYTPKMFSTLNAGVYQLGSEAADSPITTSRTGGLVGASVGYTF
jgi:outer membrane scaffolding protein for murein synthesis (MipA/OmpV family)